MNAPFNDTRQNCCPCCGQPVSKPIGFVVDLKRNIAVRNSHSVKLTPQQAEILFSLYEALPRVVPLDTLICAVYGAIEEPEGAAAVVRRQICMIRKIIEQLGAAIVTERGRGYYLQVS